MHKQFQRAGLILALLAIIPGTALADVKPDPADPTGPVGIALIGLVLAGAVGYLLYRRRNK